MRKRKPNSIRAMRELRKENLELQERLRFAQHTTDRKLIATANIHDELKGRIRSARLLGYVVEVSVDVEGYMRCEAVKREDA